MLRIWKGIEHKRPTPERKMVRITPSDESMGQFLVSENVLGIRLATDITGVGMTNQISLQQSQIDRQKHLSTRVIATRAVNWSVHRELSPKGFNVRGHKCR